jgi:CRP-like cAMP-binding protein
VTGVGTTLGHSYADGETVVRQGEEGGCMFVIQSGQVEVVQTTGGNEQHLASLGAGDFFGEMSLFEKARRSATVRSVGTSKILTVDKKTLLRRISEDPLLAFNLLKVMSHRIRDLDSRLSRHQESSS